MEEALWSLMLMLGWDGVGFNTSSLHIDNASGVIAGILAMLAALVVTDGQTTTTESIHYETTIKRTINEGEAYKAQKGQQDVLNATAMHGGRILRGATIFGRDQFGSDLIGGEAGPEALVGVNSLDQMIKQSVMSAMTGIFGRLDSLISGQGQNIQIVLDSGVLVGELVGGMDSEMNRRAAWRGGGRA